MNIFVAKLNYRTTSEAVENLFAQYGEVVSAKVIMDKDTGRSKGFAFVEMGSEDAGMAAIAGLNETQFEGQTIVCRSNPKAFFYSYTIHLKILIINTLVVLQAHYIIQLKTF